MARINIDDSIFSDPRFLCACDEIGRFAAMGEFVYIIKLAQKYWVDGEQGIPKNIYALSKFSDCFISVGLVKDMGDAFYLAGSKEYFSWISAKKENGKKGGRPKSTEPNNSEIAKATDNLKKAKVILAKANESYENPLTLPLTLTPDNNINTSAEADRVEFDFEKIYENYPCKEGKAKGIAKLKSTIKSQKKFDDFRKSAWNYMKSVESRDKKYIKHFDTFVNCWTDYVDLAPEPDKKQATTSLKSRLLKALPKYHRHIPPDDLAAIKNDFTDSELEAISSAGGFISFSQANEFELAAKIKNLGEILGGAA